MAAPPFHIAWRTAAGRIGTCGDPDALFPWWSFTKTVIAACACRLAEDGRLDLDAPANGAPYSLHQLLTHMAGLTDYGRLPEYHAAVARGDPPWSRDKMLALSEGHTQVSAPGATWGYSNIGYMFAVEALERCTDMDFGALVQSMICDPMGLTGSKVAQTQADFAATHWPEGAQYAPGWVYHRCMIGPASEAAQLLQAIATGPVLSPSSRAMMQRRIPLGGAVPGRPWDQIGYGMGLMMGRIPGLGQVFGHSGVGPFCTNAVYHFPEIADPATVAVFTTGANEALPENELRRVVEVLCEGGCPSEAGSP